MRLAAALATAAVVIATLGTAAERAKAAPPRVAAGNCSFLAAKYGPAKVWKTNFRGQQRDLWDHFWPYSASPCFTSVAACKAWLYWAQSDYPHQNSFTPCRRLAD
jgi:hypothetical protein